MLLQLWYHQILCYNNGYPGSKTTIKRKSLVLWGSRERERELHCKLNSFVSCQCQSVIILGFGNSYKGFKRLYTSLAFASINHSSLLSVVCGRFLGNRGFNAGSLLRFHPVSAVITTELCARWQVQINLFLLYKYSKNIMIVRRYSALEHLTVLFVTPLMDFHF